MNHSIEAARAFAKKHGITDGEIIDQVAKMIEHEANMSIEERMFRGQRHQWSKALDRALDLFSGWYTGADAFHWNNMAGFVCVYRRSAVYAILLGLQLNHGKNYDNPRDRR